MVQHARSNKDASFTSNLRYARSFLNVSASGSFPWRIRTTPYFIQNVLVDSVDLDGRLPLANFVCQTMNVVSQFQEFIIRN